MADEGDRAAQYSLGCRVVSRADGNVGSLGASGRSPLADVGLAPCIAQFPVAHMVATRRT